MSYNPTAYTRINIFIHHVRLVEMKKFQTSYVLNQAIKLDGHATQNSLFFSFLLVDYIYTANLSVFLLSVKRRNIPVKLTVITTVDSR